MANKFTLSKRYTRNSNSGFSLFEMIVASLISSAILAFSLSVIVQQRRQFQIDQVRGLVNQNLRSISELIGADIRQGGELLSTNNSVPTFVLVNGTNGAPDSLSIQRKLFAEDQTVSENISIGSNYAVVATGTSSDVTQQRDNWRNIIDPDNLQSPQVAYIFDTDANATAAAKRGEFFVYESDSITGSGTNYQFRINRNGTWANAYRATTSHIYLLEERTYSLAADPDNPGTFILQLLINRGVNTTTPSNLALPRTVINGLNDFQVEAQFSNGVCNNLNGVCNNLNESGTYETTINSATDPDWRAIRSFNISLTSAPPDIYSKLSGTPTNNERKRFFGTCDSTLGFKDPTCSLTLSSRFLPRNVSSR